MLNSLLDNPNPRQARKPKSKRKTQQRRNDDGIDAEINALQRLPKRVTNIFPDRYYTKLRFYGLGANSIPTTALSVGFRYRPSAAYDVDPVLGSTATPGFAEFAALYSNYRVTTSKIIVRAVNPSPTQGVQLVVLPLNQDPGASPVPSVVQEWTMNPYAKHRLMGTQGSEAITVTNSISTEKIFGSKMVYFDDNFTSLTSSIPNNNWYWGIGYLTGVAPTAAITLTTEIWIEIGVEFFSRKVLAS